MKRKFLHLLLSLLVAFGLWFYVVTVVSPESEATFYNIPVVLNNESVLIEKGLMVTSEEQPSVTLQLRGNRTDLNSLKNSDITVVADLSKINKAGNQSLSYTVSVTGGNAFEVVDQTPWEITLDVAEWATKDVEVVPVFVGMLEQNYIAYEDEIEVDYDTVTLTGPKEVVDQITKAVVEVNLDGQVETISQSLRYTLCDENGEPVDAAAITTNVAEVNVTLKVLQVKEIPLLLEVSYGGGATEQTSSVIQDYETIKVAGSEKLLEDLDSLSVGSVDLAAIAEATQIAFEIVLPTGVENLSGINQVNVSVEFPGLETKTLNVDKIFVSGKPVGMSYDIGTKVVTVTVRGPKDLIDTIDASNVTILINLADAQLGENWMKAQIMFDDTYKEVGAFGSYSVLVTMTEAGEG